MPELYRDDVLNVYIKEGEQFTRARLPVWMVKHILRDRLIERDIKRVKESARPILPPGTFGPRTVVLDFSSKKAQFFDVSLRLDWLESPWEIRVEKMTLQNYDGA
jgi:hypothetical protein